ncbi:MAG: DUF6516 family protein [bacterium]
MYESISFLNQSKIILQIEVLELIDEQSVQSIKIRAELIDGSSFCIHETMSERGYKYSYHWQDKDGKLLLRWDNASHYKEIETFSHHKHVGEFIEASAKVSIEKALECIEVEIRKK